MNIGHTRNPGHCAECGTHIRARRPCVFSKRLGLAWCDLGCWELYTGPCLGCGGEGTVPAPLEHDPHTGPYDTGRGCPDCNGTGAHSLDWYRLTLQHTA